MPPKSRSQELKLKGTISREGASGNRETASTKTTTQTIRSKSIPGRPLAPRVEHKPHEGKALAKRMGSESESWDITPDGGSAGREGREFTVANVGNNGQMYLR